MSSRAPIQRQKKTWFVTVLLLCVSSLFDLQSRDLSRLQTDALANPASRTVAPRGARPLEARQQSGSLAWAQNGDAGEIVGTPWVGEAGMRESVPEIMDRESRSTSLQRGELIHTQPELELDRTNLIQNPDSPDVAQWPDHPESARSLATQTAEPRAVQSAGASFLGAQLSESGAIPPDSMGDAGPSQFLIAVNKRIKVFDKQGNLGALNADLDAFFSSVRGGSGTSDPRVRYDRLSGRWFVTAINVATPNRIVIAVSSSDTITGSSSFTFFQFQHDLVGPVPNSDTGRFADYDTLGIDPNALYVGVNIFTGNTFASTTGFVIQKNSVLSAGSIVVTPFRLLATTTTDGPVTAQGVDNDDPAATEGYFIGVSALAFGRLIVRRVSNPGGVPAISGNMSLTVPSTGLPIDVPALGSTRPLDALDDRLYQARIHRGSLWTAHNIQVDATGVASSSGGRNASRFYEITGLTSTPILRQAGTLFDSAPANPRNFWIPSCAVSGQGHTALACSVAGTSESAEIAVAGRFASDNLGTLQAPVVVQTSASSYNVESSGTQRWGDYSAVTVDPNDDMTMWAVQEYSNATNSWGVRVIQLLAPPPAALSSASPSSVNQGVASTSIVLTGTPSGGSGFFDPGPSYPSHISATISSGVTVNSVSFTDSTHIRLDVSTIGATAGPVTVTVTNPDGQSVTSSSVLTVISCGPSITRQPSSVSTLAGRAASFSVTASGSGPLTFQWRKNGVNLSNGGNIVGATTPALTINSVTSSDAGSYDVVVNGVCSPAVTSNAATLTLLTSSAVCGDVNGDGVANSSDALLIRQVVVGLRLSTDPVFTNFSAGDVNGDGLVNATDALFIRQMVVGLRSSLPCPAAPANRFLRAARARPEPT